jgi:hypothetical protein
MLRYYVDGHQKCITLAPKNDLYRSWADVEPLIERALSQVRSEAQIVTDTIGLIEYVEKHYLPWAAENKAAVTADSYEKVWRRYWKPSFAASLKLTDLRTAEVTAVLTHHVKERIGRTDTLSLASGSSPGSTSTPLLQATATCCVLAGWVFGRKRNRAALAPQDCLDLVAEFAGVAYLSASRQLAAKTLGRLSMRGEQPHEHLIQLHPLHALALLFTLVPSPLVLIKRASAPFCNPQPNADSHPSFC